MKPGWLERLHDRRRLRNAKRWRDAEAEKRKPSPTAPVRMDALSIVVRELAKGHGCYQPTKVQVESTTSIPGQFEACNQCGERGRVVVEALRRGEFLPARPGDVRR